MYDVRALDVHRNVYFTVTLYISDYLRERIEYVDMMMKLFGYESYVYVDKSERAVYFCYQGDMFYSIDVFCDDRWIVRELRTFEDDGERLVIDEFTVELIDEIFEDFLELV